MQVVIYKLDPGRLIVSIKAVRALTGLGARESKELCEAVNDGRPQTISTSESWDVVVRTLPEGHIALLQGDNPTQIVMHALGLMPGHLTVKEALDVLRAVA